MNRTKTILLALVLPGLVFAACADETATNDGNSGDVAANGDSSQGDGVGGAADPGGTSGATDPNGTGGDSAVQCPHEGDPVFDLSLFTPCPSYVCDQGAHCVPNDLVPGEVQDFLPDCNGEMKCVPDLFIETNANFLLETCTSVMGLEGRCVSGCIPLVAERADILEQATCAEGELCAPCFDPLSGEDTMVCNLTCDPGPSEPPPEQLPSCCPDGNGTCVPGDLIPDSQEGALAQDACPEASLKCVPNQMLDPSFDPEPCEPGFLLELLGVDDGVCVPECVDAVKSIAKGGCPSGYRCAPCDAFGEPTGACPEDW